MSNPAAAAKSAYAAAGVNIDNKMDALKSIKSMVGATKTVNVVGGIGSFGGLCRLPQGSSKDTLLVSSTDGVGTKLKVAVMMKKHDTVGQDIVNHCVNDILVQGAKPLFFMDYVGASKFDGPTFQQIVSGLCKACKENNMALLGGETAEMPGLYPANEYDLVGTIVGTVSRKKLVTGQSIRAGDVIIGLPSGGLQTNGFSLARRVFFDICQMTPQDKLPGTDQTIGDALLAVHKSLANMQIPLITGFNLKEKYVGDDIGDQAAQDILYFLGQLHQITDITPTASFAVIMVSGNFVRTGRQL